MPYISTAKSFNLVRGYIEMKIKKYEIWKALTQLTLRCLGYINGMFNPNVIWHSYFLIPMLSFYEKRVKSLEKFFLQLCENAILSILLRYKETDCKYKPLLMKIETSNVVVLLNSTSCRFAQYEYRKCGNSTLILVQL